MRFKSMLLRLGLPGKYRGTGQCNVYRTYMNRNILSLHERGMYDDIFPNTSADRIIDLLNKSPQCVYAGFDPTSSSLHVGNLLVLMNLLHWQRGGHRVIALLGGATGLIGDPSHRETERAELAKAIVVENVASIKSNIETIFQNHQEYFWNEQKDGKLKPVIFENNINWYLDVNAIEFIRQVGKHFRMGTMLGRTSVQARLNSHTGMSFTEFTYPLFQAYDWLHLIKKHDCRFQIGGNDQMGNIVSGYDLITKMTDKKPFGLTLPLITAEGGKKFGKSLGNAVWLDPKRSSSFQLYQFFLRSKDSDVEKFLKFFTFLSVKEIRQIVAEHEKNAMKREAQRILAENVTLLVHGEGGLQAAKRTSEMLYDKSLDNIVKMTAEELAQVFEGANIVNILPEAGMTVYDLAVKANCFKKQSQIAEIIAAGGFQINHQKVTNVSEVVTHGVHILANNLSLIRVGKKNYHIVKWMT